MHFAFGNVVFVCLEYDAVYILVGGDVYEKAASASLVNCVQSIVWCNL